MCDFCTSFGVEGVSEAYCCLPSAGEGTAAKRNHANKAKEKQPRKSIRIHLLITGGYMDVLDNCQAVDT